MHTIGLLGGTGDLGTALAVHLAKKYDSVLIGSRSREKAQATVNQILEEKGYREYLKTHLKSGSNNDVVKNCDIIIVTVPHESAVETVKQLAQEFRGEQILISSVAALSKIGDQFFPVRTQNSISKQIQELVPSSVNVATAFQTIPATMLYREKEISADVPVACNSLDVYRCVSEIVSSINGLRPLYVGTLELSSELEGLTALLLNIAVRNHLKSPTLKLHSF